MDADVEALVADATLPICLRLAEEDTVGATPAPCYLCVPRSSLLAALWQAVADSFLQHVADFGTSPAFWLAGPDGRMLSWALPVGAVADTLMAHGGAKLPLSLTARVGAPPKGEYAWAASRRKDMAILAQHTLKAALMLMYRELKPFYKLAPSSIENFVDHALSCDASRDRRDAYCAAVAEMQRINGEPAAHWPVRVHMAHASTSTLVAVHVAAGVVFGDVLRQVLPPGIAAAPGCNLASVDVLPDEPFVHPAHSIVLDGIPGGPLLTTPMAWLAANMAATDLAIHVVVCGERVL